MLQPIRIISQFICLYYIISLSLSLYIYIYIYIAIVHPLLKSQLSKASICCLHKNVEGGCNLYIRLPAKLGSVVSHHLSHSFKKIIADTDGSHTGIVH